MIKDYHIDNNFKSQWEKKIFSWYLLNKRDLPWRKKKNQNFYRIWISEVMLQQTQVLVVIPFYKKFIKKWPNLDMFYNAKLDEILAIWQGMGYYKRAHNLFKAKELLKDKEIEIDSISLKKLPGVGDYISSAISAILKDEPCAVVDGNIRRILMRVFDLKYDNPGLNSHIKKISQKLTPKYRNGDYCQSLMDLSNLVCKLRNPKCNVCPISNFCLSKGKSFNNFKTRKIKKKKSVSFVVRSGKYFLLEKTSGGLLQNLFSFPLSDLEEVQEGLSFEEYLKKNVCSWMEKNELKSSFRFIGEVNHKFSHFHLKVFIVELKLLRKLKKKKYYWLTYEEIEKKPVSKLMIKLKEKVK